MRSINSAPAFSQERGTKNQEPGAEVFRPEPAKFPPLEKAQTYDGQLIFVVHANRRGSIRVRGEEQFFRNKLHPFAMLPYGMVRYHGAPADLRDIPLGTVVYGQFYLPPNPKFSSVPVSKSEQPTEPAENHAILLEDDPSRCLRAGKVWKLSEVDVQNNREVIVAGCRLGSMRSSTESLARRR